MDCVSVKILVVTLYYSYVRHYHWGILGEGAWDLCVIFHNFISK